MSVILAEKRDKRGEVVTSRCLGCHGFWISTNRGPAHMTENSKKVDMHSCARLHSGTELYPRLFFHRSTIQMAVSVKKDCFNPEILLAW